MKFIKIESKEENFPIQHKGAFTREKAMESTLILHYGDLTDSMNLTHIIQEVQPDEIYNLAAMSHVKVSFVLKN